MKYMAQPELKKVIAPREGEEPKQKTAVTSQILVFLLDQEEYAIPITDAREIIPIVKITPVPNAPAFMRGIVNLRGKIVVVIDLEKRFGFRREHPVVPKHIIVLEVNGTYFGVIVDVVQVVLVVSQSQVEKTRDSVTRKIPSDYWQGVVVLGEQPEQKPKKQKRKEDQKDTHLITLLNLTKLLQEKELGHFQEDLSSE